MKTLPMPDLSDDEVADRFYNSGTVISSGTRDVHGCLESINKVLREHHGLEIGFYDSGSSDYLFTILPYEEETVVLYHVVLTFEHHGEHCEYECDVRADTTIDAINIADKIERRGRMISAKAQAFDVPQSRVKDYIND